MTQEIRKKYNIQPNDIISEYYISKFNLENMIVSKEQMIINGLALIQRKFSEQWLKPDRVYIVEDYKLSHYDGIYIVGVKTSAAK